MMMIIIIIIIIIIGGGELLMSQNNSDLQPVFWSYHGTVFICKGRPVLSVEICCRKTLNVHQ